MNGFCASFQPYGPVAVATFVAAVVAAVPEAGVAPSVV
jgi:hypothetical protein